MHLKFVAPALLFAAPAFAHVNNVRVCNYRAEVVWASYATDTTQPACSGLGCALTPPVVGPFKSNGWYEYQPGQCYDLITNYTGAFKFFAYGPSGWTSSDAFGFDATVSPSQICV